MAPRLLLVKFCLAQNSLLQSKHPELTQSLFLLAILAFGLEENFPGSCPASSLRL